MKYTTLDVTLRDGGYKNNFHFPASYIDQHINLMALAGLDWIEVGYRNGSHKLLKDAGDVAYCTNSYLQQLKHVSKNAKISVIGHPQNLEIFDIDALVAEDVGMLRICCSTSTIEKAKTLIKAASDAGLVVCANITRSSQLRLTEMLHLSEQAASAGADVIYIADSNGSMQPDRVSTFVESVMEVTDCFVGFHAHDHLGLAMPNSLAAVEAGATYIDASLNGVGKGAGNLRLESWVSYLSKKGEWNNEIDLILLQLPLLEEVIARGFNRDVWLELILAYYDISFDDRRIFSKNNVGMLHDLRAARRFSDLRT